MSAVPEATTAQERLVFIRADREELLAVYTEPTAPSNDIAVVLFTGRSSVTSIGRSRLWTVLARRLATLGFHSLRIDHRGTGDSTGTERPWLLHAPFLDDAEAAAAWIREQGIDQFVTMGTCGGARLALAAAQAIPGARGAALFCPPVRDVLKGDSSETLPMGEFMKRGLSWRNLSRMRQKEVRQRYIARTRRKLSRALKDRRSRGKGEPRTEFAWASPLVVSAVRDLVERQAHVMFLFGEDDLYYGDYKRALDGKLGKVVAHSDGLVTTALIPDRFHRLPALEVQDHIWKALQDWLPSVGGKVSAATTAAD